MAVSEKRKKTRLYQVAKEFNISHESLIDFLDKKGFKVKNHMAAVDDTMYEAVERQYRKDRVEAERHAIKRKEFDEQDRKRRGDEKPKDAKPSGEADELQAASEIEDSAPTDTTEATGDGAVSEPVTAGTELGDQPESAVADPAEAGLIDEQSVQSPPKDELPAPPAATIMEEVVASAEPPEKASGADRGEAVTDSELPATKKSKVQPEAKEAAKTKPPKAEAPKAEAPKAEVPKAEVPKAKSSKGDTPTPKSPAAKAQEAPAAEAESPKPDALPTDAPQADARKADAPQAETPETKTPDADSTETKTPPPTSLAGTPEKSKKPKESVSIESSMPKMGLKVMGRIELAPKKKAPVKGKPGEAPPAGKTDGTAGAAGDDKPHKKKKKKRIVAVKQEVTTDKTETDASKRRKKKKGTKREVDQAEVNEAIRRTIASMGDMGSTGRTVGKKRKRIRRQEEEARQIERDEKAKSVINVYEYASVSDLASLMNVDVASVIGSLMGLGIMASINQRLDLETIELVAAEFGFDVSKEEEVETGSIDDVEDDPESLQARPPIVTIMGHVDHGKTSLLDHIRDTNVVAGESGGITQHIGAYTVTVDGGRKITFLDTPGHEAFTAMRARGAQATDIVVLVVAADDSVMPQTVEAISHARAANVPIVIAINKIDKPDANPERIKQQLAERNILVEDWNGKYGSVEISAKQGLHIDDLMDRILLEADILELKANPDRAARGVIVEAQLDKGKGVVATVIVQKGTLKVGDAFVAGTEYGRVRALLDERDNRVEDAPPSTPVQVLGFDGLPTAGDSFIAVESDREAREVASVRQQVKRESDFRSVRRQTLDDISEQIKIGGVQDLALIVKADVDGSSEALADSLQKLSNAEVRIDVIHKSVGAISESDVLLAAASNAIIIGFHVRPNMAARKLAESEKVDIRLYEIIYDAINDVKSALEGMLRPEISERILASVGVREVFKISKVGTIAGCMVLEGKIHRNNRIRLVRDGISVFAGAIDSLKRFKDDVREVDQGFECGISLAGYNDIKVGDIIEAYEIVETKRQLS